MTNTVKKIKPTHNIIWRFIHLFKIHKMKLKFITIPNKYYECEICGKRDVTYPFDGCYQPIDINWINRKDDTFSNNLPS